MALPPGPTLPAAVQTYRWMFRPVPFMARLAERYGDMFTVRLLQFGSLVALSDPEHIRAVFKGDPKIMHAGEGNAILRPMLGDTSVLLLDEEEHMRQRRLLLPPFHGDRMLGYRDTIIEIAGDSIDRWPRGEPFAMRERMQEITLEVILRVIFGITDRARSAAFRERLIEIDPNSFRLLALPVMRRRFPGGPWSRFLRVRNALDVLIFDEIERRRAIPEDRRGDDILSMLLAARDEDGEAMSDVELRDELVTLVTAGHETTATSLAWTFELLYRHPEVHRRAVAEAATDSDEYLDAMCKEALRLRPVIPMVARRLTAEFEVGGYRIPAGTVLAPNIYLTHRRPDIYPDPEVFRPERFIDASPDTYAWLPFGGGVRRCIGASFALYEMRAILRVVLGRATLRPAVDRPERIVRRAVTFAPEFDALSVLEDLRPASRVAEPVAPGAG